MSREHISVEAPDYVPFEPRTDASRVLRGDLRTRLRKLAARDGEVLSARFFGPLPRGADVENALLYNIDVDGGAFAAAARFGVRFEHDPSPLLGGGVRYEYGVEPLAAGLGLWTPSRRLASVETGLETPPTLAAIWWALRERGRVEIGAPRRRPDERFAVSLRVAGPVQSARPALVKTLIDGVVCALQSQTDREEADAVAPLLSSVLPGAPKEQVRSHLVDESLSVLCARARLLHRRGKGVQWAPDDDYCVAGEVLLERAERWSFNGTVSVVTRR
jgi:hypothetical protein